MQRKLIAGLVAAIIVIGGVRIGMTLSDRKNDQQQIEIALQDSINDSKEGRPGGVLELFSKQLTVNQESMPVDRGAIAKFIREQKPTLTVENKQAKFIGQEARIVSPVNLSVPIFGEKRLSEVTMIFKKEPDVVYGIIPSERWRLTDVRLPDDAYTQLLGQ